MEKGMSFGAWVMALPPEQQQKVFEECQCARLVGHVNGRSSTRDKGHEMRVSTLLRSMASDASNDIGTSVRSELRTLADRIDDEMVELPCDADGTPWHLGDRCVAHDRLTCASWHGKIIEFQLREDDGFIARVLLDKRPQSVRFNIRDITRPHSPSDRLREWVRRARTDEHMDLRELDAIADEMDEEARDEH